MISTHFFDRSLAQSSLLALLLALSSCSDVGVNDEPDDTTDSLITESSSVSASSVTGTNSSTNSSVPETTSLTTSLAIEKNSSTGSSETENAETTNSEETSEQYPENTTTPLAIEDISYAVVAVSASDYQDPNFPENTIDGRTEDESRWSAFGRTDVWLQLDLGELQPVNALDIFFLKNDERNTCFTIQTSTDGADWATRRSNIVSDGERIFDMAEVLTRYIRIVGLGNSDNEWNSIIEVDVQWRSTTGSEDVSDGDATACPAEISGGTDANSETPIEEQYSTTFNSGSLDGNRDPGENFDLTYWKITYPDATEAYPPEVREDEFYTDPDTGAMVFESVNQGERTSSSTKYSRSELREMLRGTDSSIGTKDLGNNWVSSAADRSVQAEAGAVDGNMKATVAVNTVSTTYSDSNDYMVGRVIVGQIHGSENEPFKIYYRKLPGNTKGSVYFSYEDSLVEQYFEFFGDRSTDASDPEDGISLGEKWSYEVNVTGREMVVTVAKEDGTTLSKAITWASEYDNDWFFFKAGNYNQNNGGDDGDYASVSFYALDVSH